MMPQDWIFSVGAWIFALAFIPSFRKREYPNISTSAITGTVLLVYVFNYLSLGLWISAISGSLTVFCWYAMLYLKWRNKKEIDSLTVDNGKWMSPED